jgi:hypothetical protein
MRILSVLIILIFTSKASDLGLLLKVENNSVFYFSSNNRQNICIAYAIVSFDMLFNASKNNELCRKTLLQYYKKHPKEKNFAKNYFHINQQYAFERKDSSCIIYAQGKRSYAELLLKNGMAIVAKGFRDEVIKFKYKRIENQAKIEKKGLWDNPILRNCISQIEL